MTAHDRRHPTLRQYFFSRFGSGAAIALALMLGVSLLTADALSSRSAARVLLNDLKDGAVGGWGRGRGRGGVQTLTPDALNTYSQAWPDAAHISERGEGYGYGRVPWTSQSVAWAALRRSDGAVDISWTRLSSVRAAAGGTYILVTSAVVISFALAAFVTDIGVTRVAKAVGSAASASRKMAEGDFAASMDVRDTDELSDLSDAVNHLAASLDRTLTQLNAEKQELARLERMQRQFVADASHELRAPLTSMAITLDAASDGLMTDAEKQDAWPLLRSEVRRLSRTVTDLLDLSRIESGREPMNMELIDVEHVVTDVHRWYQALPGDRPTTEMRIERSMEDPEAGRADLADQRLEAFADADALHRCLVNFVDNSIKATPPGGKITIWARRGRNGRVQAGVTDSGAGMTEEELARAWERFARSEKARGSGREGSGLGLSIVHALAQAMGAQVGLESKVGKGTTAWIELSTTQLTSH